MEKQKERAVGKNLISFGAPGTGKSYSIKEEMQGLYDKGKCPSCLIENSTEDIDDKIAIRTTFHPDSDYSTFVGCYKPRKVGNVLTYEFTPQAFVNAYVNAWKTNEPYFLIIEEINRGNCAQIFGDIFQVLDRKADGEHEYSIKPDTDLETYLREEGFNDLSNWPEIPAEIREGKILYLPKNLTVLATMNTSDQSLFPMDSAFKRRWEWHYVPIKDGEKNYGIEIGEKKYDWFDFITKINQKIVEVTEADDKQIGYWFVKFKEAVNGLMDAETFVSKVIFYLWMDVFKDMGRNENSPFSIKKNYIDDGDDAKNEKTDEDSVFWGFKDFIDSNGKANIRRVQSFLYALGIISWTRKEYDNNETESILFTNTQVRFIEDHQTGEEEKMEAVEESSSEYSTFSVTIKGEKGWETPNDGHESATDLIVRLLKFFIAKDPIKMESFKRAALTKSPESIKAKRIDLENLGYGFWYNKSSNTTAKMGHAKRIQQLFTDFEIKIEGTFPLKNNYFSVKILIEEYEYDVEVLKQYVDNPQVLFPTNNKECGEKRSTDEVGYYFNNQINDCVFILPKVVLQGKEEGIEESKQDESTATSDDNANNTLQKVFGKYDPEKIIDLDKSGIDTQIMAFIRQFSVWIYRAVNVYRLRDLEQRKSVKSKFISKVNNYEDELEGTILDPILALIEFYNQNRHFLMFSLKDIHRGFNKIHWAKTIGRQTPVKQSDGSMFYMHPINRKKQVDYDEDLYVVFFSILNYLKKRMGFPIHLDLNLELLPLSVIEHYRSGYGKIYLRQIKYRYFADKELKLWKLCYAFFESSSNISTHEFAEEYLIVNKFEHVFEDIIDSLLRDSNVPKRNKEQRDGKIVDHIYKYQSLVNDEPLYYIGDSKYYKMGHEVRGTQSEYKQYTYAKNVIQYNLELFLKKSGIDHLQYRDKLTEGYNITPNFFISGQINPENLSYDVSGLVPHMFKVGNKETNTTKQEQFENRLFDRDTLWLSHYDINFLYVISLYVRNNDLANRTFSENAKRTFREKIIEAIGSYYDFYVLTPKKDNYRSFEATVRQLFWLLNGKIYRPNKDKELLVLAILKETSDQERTELFGNVDLYFDKKEGYQLGSDMATFINESEPIAQNNH